MSRHRIVVVIIMLGMIVGLSGCNSASSIPTTVDAGESDQAIKTPSPILALTQIAETAVVYTPPSQSSPKGSANLGDSVSEGEWAEVTRIIDGDTIEVALGNFNTSVN